MQFPKGSQALTGIFQKAQVPQLGDFNGVYSVHMLTVLPSLRAFLHRKVFYQQAGTVVGHNMIFRNKKWGYFSLQADAGEDVDSGKALQIKYETDRRKNSFISSRMMDYVRCIEPGRLYLGRFYLFLFGRYRFCGYFSLSKIG